MTVLHNLPSFPRPCVLIHERPQLGMMGLYGGEMGNCLYSQTEGRVRVIRISSHELRRVGVTPTARDRDASSKGGGGFMDVLLHLALQHLGCVPLTLDCTFSEQLAC